MGSSELFHFIPSPLSSSQALVKRPLTLLFCCQAFHPTDRYNVPEALRWLFSRFLPPCSEIKKKKEGLSWALSLSFPRGEEEVGGEEVMEGGSYPATSPPLERSCDPSRPCLLPHLPNHCETWQMKRSFLNERKWAEYETEALTQWTCLDCHTPHLIRY